MYLLQDMSIEEFKEPIYCLDNFASAVKFCKLCCYDALSVSCYLDDKYQFYRYLNIEGLFIYFFKSKQLPRLYVVISSGSSLKSLQEQLTHNLDTIDKLKSSIILVLDTLNQPELTTYCIGHSAAGSYAYYLASQLSLKTVTIGQLPLSLNKLTMGTMSTSDCAVFTATGDLLCVQDKPNIIKIKTTPPINTLEGVVNHSIDSYLKVINESKSLQDLEVEPDLIQLPEEILVS